ncbi:hypothetical protein, partial [Fulvimarina pelagi]
MNRANTVYVIQPKVDAVRAIAEVVADTPGSSKTRLFCPDRHSQTELASVIRDRDLPYELLAFESVGGEHDDLLYGFCQAVAEGYSACVREEWRWSHFVALQDRLVAALRGPYVLERLLSDEPDVEVALVSSPDETSNRALWDLLAASFGKRLRSVGSPPPSRNAAQEVWDAIQRGGLRGYDETAIRKLERSKSRGRLCLSIATGNLQYVGVAAPLLNDLTRTFDLVISNASLGPFEPDFLKNYLPNPVKKLALVDLVKVPTVKASMADLKRMRDVGRSASRIATGYEQMEDRFGPALHDFALRECMRLERLHRVIWRQAKRLVSCVDGVIVVPGRHLPSNILVAAAHEVGLPTFDVQTGTITRTRRFLAPAAKTVFALNDESARMFARLGKKDGVLPIGSFKVDHDMAPYRTLNKVEARSCLGLSTDGDVWLFASQPLGVKTIITVARVVCDAALARGGVTVLIKMHPNETSPYRQAYDELARTYNIEILVNQEAKSPIAIVASDAVFTHFSSVAIEAHAMQKPAIAVNPFGKPLPFDLDSSGIAPEISSPEEIVPTLKRLAANESAVDVLRDGRALER